MAKKAVVETSRNYELCGGPRDGNSLRLVFPPVEYLRLAFPVWCTYKWDGNVYKYWGSERPPYKENAL